MQISKQDSKIDKQKDPWYKFKQFTSARIGIGRAGMGIPTREFLQFQLAHAKARDAVLFEVNFTTIKNWLARQKHSFIELESACMERQIYLTRPDLGRTLSNSSVQILKKNHTSKDSSKKISLSIVIVDGLSSSAIENNIIPLFKILLPKLKNTLTIAPITLIKNGRVAIGDEISYKQKTDVCIVFIGERPGLSSPDSLGVYLTFNAKPGTTDERRNCISNIRVGGLSYSLAAKKIVYLLNQSILNKISGVSLKDDFQNDLIT